MVTSSDSLVVLEKTLEATGQLGASEEVLNHTLQNLTEVVKSSISDINLRHELAKSHTSWRLIKVNLEQIPSDGNVELKFRLIRGVVLLARNLLSVDREVAEQIHFRRSVFQFGLHLQKFELDQSLHKNCMIAAFQCLCNLTVNKKEHDAEVLHELVAVFESVGKWDENTLLPVFIYFKNIMDTPDFLYHALSKGEGKPIFSELLIEFEKLDLQADLTQYGILVVSIFSKLVVHESFLKFITMHNEPEVTVRYLKVAEAIITSKDSWEVFELTVILSWVYELFKRTISEVQAYFDGGKMKEPKFTYEKVSCTLDILSVLSKFEHARKFFLSYEGVQNLVGLLGIIQKNVTPKKLKDDKENKSEPRIEYGNFPHVKSFIIEILSSLVHQNFEVQELMREIHGLELVLSNCIIDDNEPFIRERSIVCLRFLLLNNDKNQEFVSKLEAKEAVKDETLDEAGFEVEIQDGKVKLKQKKDFKKPTA